MKANFKLHFLLIKLGGPVIAWFPEEDRFFLIGVIQGAFYDCTNTLPGIFVRVEVPSILNFLQTEIFQLNITKKGNTFPDFRFRKDEKN